MPASAAALVQAIERSLFVLTEVPGLVSEIGVPGVMGREEMLPLELFAWVPPGVRMDLHA